MEYTKAEIPVLASKRESHEELAQQFGHILLFDADSNKSIATSIDELFSNHPAFKRKAEEARKAISWEREVSNLIHLYGSVGKRAIQNSSK